MARRLTATTLAVAVALGACAEADPPFLETSSVLDALPASVWPADPSLVDDVACPDLVAEPIAQASSCTATLDDDPITVAIVIDDDGVVGASVDDPLFDVAAAAQEMGDRLATDLGIARSDVDVACDRAVRVAVPGAATDCVADRSGDPLEFRMVLLDDAGAWEPVFAVEPVS